MIEVHPPEEPIHTWKDFFIHVGTICIGLLIAIGLEQTVEAIHHHNQLAELRQALQQDNVKALRDEKENERYSLRKIAWLTANLDEASHAMRMHRQPHYLEVPQDLTSALDAILSEPVDPTWKAARASNLIEVMPQEDVKAFSEIDVMIAAQNTTENEQSIEPHLDGFLEQFRLADTGNTIDLSHATHADLVTYLELLTESRSKAQHSLLMYRYLRGALQAVLRGERDLDKIDDEENKVRDHPALTAAN